MNSDAPQDATRTFGWETEKEREKDTSRPRFDHCLGGTAARSLTLQNHRKDIPFGAPRNQRPALKLKTAIVVNGRAPTLVAQAARISLGPRRSSKLKIYAFMHHRACLRRIVSYLGLSVDSLAGPGYKSHSRKSCRAVPTLLTSRTPSLSLSRESNGTVAEEKREARMWKHSRALGASARANVIGRAHGL